MSHSLVYIFLTKASDLLFSADQIQSIERTNVMFHAMSHNQFLCKLYFAESRTDIALTQRVCSSTVSCAREKQTASGGPCKLEEKVLFTSIAAF